MKETEKKVKKYLKKILKILKMQEMRVLPGNVAFFFVLALIPMITIILTWFSDYSTSLINLITGVVPNEVSYIIKDAINNENSGSGLIFNIIVLLSASNGTNAIINVANTLYKVEESNPIVNRIKSIILLFFLSLLLIFLLIVPMFGGKILLLFERFNFYNELLLLYNLVKWPISFFLIYVDLKLIFIVAPSKKIRNRDTTIGALFTTIIWTIATAIFSYYLQNFANYTVLYGNLASIIILMMWIYIISYVFVLGIAINSVNSEQ